MIGLGVALALIVLATLLWQRFGPTRVVLVNYPDFQAARIAREAQGPWVRVQRVDTQQLQKAEGAGLVLVFGRGLALDQDERAALRRLAADTPLLMEASTDPAMDLTNLKGRHLDAVSTYLSQGGASNYASVLAYVRREMQGRLGGPQPEPPQTIPLDVLFHIGDQNIFPSVEAFEDYAAEAGLFQPEAPRVALLTSVPGPFNSNREHVDGLIQAMQERQWNVYPVAAFTGRLSLLQAINPDLVLYMPHGRLTLDQAAEAREWLKSRNIPLLTPLAVFQDEQEWRRDAQGFAGPLLTMSLALPELDGAVAPFVVAAQNTDAAGYQVFTPLPQRMQRFLDLAEGYLRLKSRPKAEQKLAIVYFKGPGMSALTAGDLEVGPSLYRLLQVLRAQGYTVEGLPATFDDFQDLLHSQGRVLAPYAAGEQAAFFAEADPARVSVPTYRTWCAQAGIQSNCEAVDAHYGSAPGQYLVSPEGEIGVARLQFGNVVLLPQPLAGIGEDTFQLVHGANAPPPHPYVASYLWARFGFGADALMHFGTHGSLEFTPGKQVALSSADWADALVGDLPHVYLYTMSNVGEAIIAKRRTYATIVSHLTPPLREAGLRSELGALAQSLQALQSADEVLASEYRQQARKLAVSTGLASDLD
ncbi:MAG: cobaltochelatase subunit CobN, partial [Oceanococcaceae bacterium]